MNVLSEWSFTYFEIKNCEDNCQILPALSPSNCSFLIFAIFICSFWIMDFHRNVINVQGLAVTNQFFYGFNRFFRFGEVTTCGAIFRIKVHVFGAGALAEVTGMAAVVRADVNDGWDNGAHVVVVQQVTVKARTFKWSHRVSTFLDEKLKCYF